MTTAEWFHQTREPMAYSRANEAFAGWDVILIFTLAAIVLIFIHNKIT